MSDEPRRWPIADLLAELGDGVVYARDDSARVVPVPDVLGLHDPAIADIGWERQTADMSSADRTAVARLWWQAISRPGEVQRLPVRRLNEGEWRLAQVSLVDVRHQRELGVVLVAARDLGPCDPPSEDDPPPPDETARFARPTWILQELDVLGCVLGTEGDVEVVFGRTAESLLGHNMLEVIHPADHEACLEMWTTLLDEPRGTRTIQQRVVRADGSACWIESTVMNRLEPDGSGVILSISHDITERREEERSLRSQALQDALTGLPNRTALLSGITAALARGPATVAFVDLDGFKEVNDRLGHHAGDDLLAALALRLRSSVPDGLLVGRWGGDEFVLVADGHDEPCLRRPVEQAFADPISVGDGVWQPECSYGIAIGSPGDDPAALIRSADTAMYEAKEQRLHR